MNGADGLIRRRAGGLPLQASRPGGLHRKALWAAFGLTALLGLMELPAATHLALLTRWKLRRWQTRPQALIARELP